MFLSNVRTALIVAINIPLALLFAFAVLYLRGMSANLLSIGAVDFGIIVDSSVIMVENIYRHLSSGEYAELSLERADPQGHARSRARPVFHDGDHGLRLRAAVHDAGAGRADLRADGRHVRVCPGRRTDPGPDDGAGRLPVALQESAAVARQLARAHDEAPLSAKSAALPATTAR